MVEIFLQNIMYFGRYKKDNLLINNMYFGSDFFLFSIAQNKTSFLPKLCTCILTMYIYLQPTYLIHMEYLVFTKYKFREIFMKYREFSFVS
jgi:hypothetical protein